MDAKSLHFSPNTSFITSVLAAVVHPFFKSRWLKCDKMIDFAKKEIVKKMVLLSKTNCQEASPDKQTNADGFFEFEQPKISDQQAKLCFELELSKFLQDSANTLASLKNYSSVFQKTFLFYNTILPSSATIERVFSYAGMIFGPKRSSLTDVNFEMLLFCKINSKFLNN
jgi:hypothetical protein